MGTAPDSLLRVLAGSQTPEDLVKDLARERWPQSLLLMHVDSVVTTLALGHHAAHGPLRHRCDCEFTSYDSLLHEEDPGVREWREAHALTPPASPPAFARDLAEIE